VTLGHEETYFLDWNSNSRKTFYGVDVKKGDEVRVVGQPQGREAAPLDYVVFLPEGVVD
jgi:alpha-glucuronidase